MVTRCKFRVTNVSEPFVGPERQQQITLAAQYCPDTVPEDRNFSKFTPNGKMEFTVTNPAVIDRFKPGQEYYIDLIPVE